MEIATRMCVNLPHCLYDTISLTFKTTHKGTRGGRGAKLATFVLIKIEGSPKVDSQLNFPRKT